MADPKQHEMTEGAEAFDRFRDAMAGLVTVPKSEMPASPFKRWTPPQRIAKARQKKSAQVGLRAGRERKRPIERSALPEDEVAPDAWQRFERTVDAAAASGPKHRPPKDRPQKKK